MDEPRIELIRRLLDIDGNLASMHTRLTGVDIETMDTIFWKNYFFHCEETRTNELCRRKNHYSEIKGTTKASSPNKTVNASGNDSFVKENDEMESARVVRYVANGNNDEESLVPVDSDTENQCDDSSSYVIQSPPNSADTFATTRSIDDGIVLVGTHSKRLG